MIDCGRVHLQRDDIVSPLLRTNVSHFCPGAGDEIIHAASKTRRGPATGAEVFDHSNLSEFIRDEEQMWKNRHVIVSQPMEDFDRQFDLDSTRHKKKCS